MKENSEIAKKNKGCPNFVETNMDQRPSKRARISGPGGELEKCMGALAKSMAEVKAAKAQPNRPPGFEDKVG